MATDLINLNKRENSSFSLVLIDIDDFKKVNDTFGHQVGDEVLIKVAHELKMAIRKSDILARYGGEEFIVAFPNTNKLEAELICTKILKNIITKKFISTEDWKITISLGISEEYNDTLDKLISKADIALYDAKKAGKSRIIIHN